MVATIYEPGPLGNLQRKLPVIGRAVAEAIGKLAPHDPHRFTFALFVLDPETGSILFSTNHEREGLYAALAEFLSHQSH